MITDTTGSWAAFSWTSEHTLNAEEIALGKRGATERALPLQKLFPLNGRRRLRADVVHHAVDALDFV